MMNQKPGPPGGPPTKQYTTANTCPLDNCPGGAVLTAQPPPGTIAAWWSRCQRCLTYWETSPGGKVVVLRGINFVELCPDCREPKDLFAPKNHVCTRREV
mgnify:FL=1